VLRRSWSVSRKGCWLFRIRSRASSRENQAARSASGISMVRPERGGHSMRQVFETSAAGSQSPSKAQAETSLPPACLMMPRSMRFA
jgi:hypothetical protein